MCSFKTFPLKLTVLVLEGWGGVGGGNCAKFKPRGNEGRKGSEGEKEGWVCGTCLELCPKFGKWSSFSLPCFHPPPLKYPACFNQGSRGGNLTGLGTKSFHMGTGWVLLQYWTQRQSTKVASVSGNERPFVLWASLRDERMWLAGNWEDVNVSLRWQVTGRPVFDMKKEGGSIFGDIPPSYM